MSDRGRGLRVLQVCSSRSWGGMEMHVGIISEHLRTRGHSIYTACKVNSSLYEDLVSRHFDPIPFGSSGYFNPWAIFKVAVLLRKLQIEIIHCHYSKDLWTLTPAARLAGRVPIVFIKHIGTMRPKKDVLHRWIYAQVAQVIAISAIIERNLLETHPLDPSKVQVIHHGVDLQRFDAAACRAQEVRRELGIPTDAVVVGTVGRLEAGKGHLEFLEMAARIAEQADVRFVIVGGATHGEEERSRPILEKARKLNLGDRLILTGFRRDIPEVLAAMDVFAFPSRAEAFGLVLIEAMAAGLPVVSSACDGVLDVIGDGETGILVPAQDVAALTAAVLSLVRDAQLRGRFGAEGRRRAEERFTVEKMVSGVESVYLKALARGVEQTGRRAS